MFTAIFIVEFFSSFYSFLWIYRLLLVEINCAVRFGNRGRLSCYIASLDWCIYVYNYICSEDFLIYVVILGQWTSSSLTSLFLVYVVPMKHDHLIVIAIYCVCVVGLFSSTISMDCCVPSVCVSWVIDVCNFVFVGWFLCLLLL